MPVESLKILLLNFSSSTAKSIHYYAQEMGWTIEEECVRPRYLRKIKTNDYALILMDDTVADKSSSMTYIGEVKQAIRNESGLLLVTGGGSIERISGLRAGADDCISKPYSVRELLYRMKTLLNRLSSISTRSVQQNECVPCLLSARLELDKNRPFVWVNHLPIHLTSREHTLLNYLTDHANQIISREELLQQVWQSRKIEYFRTVDTTIKRIREKFNQVSPHLGGIIRTEWGQGYCLLDLSTTAN